MNLRRFLLLAILAGCSWAAVAAQEGDTPGPPYPMLFPAGINIPYDPTEPWDAPAGPGNAAAGPYTCATWENGALQLIPYRDELWIFFDPGGGPWIFCGIPLPYPYPSAPAALGEIGGGASSDANRNSDAIPISSAAQPAVIVGDFTIRALADLSVAELARAQEDGVIPHERLADGGYVLGFPAAPITLVVFSDYACPYCLVYEQEVIPQVVEIFVATGRARLEYRFFPTVDNRTGGYLSKLAACVGELAEERFWAGHAFLYERAGRGRLNAANTGQLLADATALAFQELQACTQTVQQVAIDTDFGRRAGVRGTPMISFRYRAAGPGITPAQAALSFADLSDIIKKAVLR